MAELKPMKDIATFSKEEIQEFLDSFDTIISDCDGVLWVFGNPIAGSPQTVCKLISRGKKVILMSNNAIIGIDRYKKICQVLGMPIEEEDIFTPATGIAMFLKSHDIKDEKVFVVGPEALTTHLQQNGMQCCEKGVDTLPEEPGALQAELHRLDPDVRAVVLDMDINLNYLKLMRAAFHLKNPNCLFVVGATDKNVCIKSEEYVVGPGYFCSMLEDFTGRKATVIGKPSTYMTDAIVKQRRLDPARVLFIGDSLAQDIGLGKTAGFQTLLVLSGNNSLADVTETNQPDYYIRTLSDLLPLLPEAQT